jgi:benzoate transport
MGGTDPETIIGRDPMSPWQWLVVLVTVGLNSLDGFDVLSISFASPGIARDWHIDKGTLGWVLSIEQIGMALGSVLLGGVADKVGRRPTLLGCLIAMATGMFGAAHSTAVAELLAWRVLTGLGIGGTLAAINATAAEFSSLRWRNLAMSLMVIGYPVGGVLGGLFVQRLLARATWHDIFGYGAVATALFLPVVWLLVPETVAFLDRRRPAGALDKINRTLARFGHARITQLSDPHPDDRGSGLDIFKPGLLLTTILMTFGYFAHITSFYFILKWVPKIVVDMGFAPTAGAAVLTWANIGGATGGVLFGLIATRVGLKQLTIIVLLGAFAMITWFGRGAPDIVSLSATVAVVGLFTNSGVAGFYLLLARVYPTHVRASGTGFAVGLGRGGATLAPVIAGYLFQAGFGLPVVAALMAIGSLMSALALTGVRVPKPR